MRRTILNRVAALVIAGGGLFLATSPAWADVTCSGPAGEGGCSCTSGDGKYTCTGDTCTASSTGCSSADKVAQLESAPVN